MIKNLKTKKELNISLCPRDSYIYALNNNCRFKLGEPAISESAEYSYCYARNVIEGRFELAGKTISKNANYSYLYAWYVIGGRFELGEPAIAKDNYFSYLYASEILKDRFRLGEPLILMGYEFINYTKNCLRFDHG